MSVNLDLYVATETDPAGALRMLVRADLAQDVSQFSQLCWHARARCGVVSALRSTLSGPTAKDFRDTCGFAPSLVLSFWDAAPCPDDVLDCCLALLAQEAGDAALLYDGFDEIVFVRVAGAWPGGGR